MSWANVRAGRIDRHTASRLAIAVGALSLTAWAFGIDHVAGSDEMVLVNLGLKDALFLIGATAVLYLALEPHVRRRWPAALVGWTRLFAGGWRDPLVGQEVLAGTAAGVLFFCLRSLISWVVSSVGTDTSLSNATSVAAVASLLAAELHNALFLPVLVGFFLLLLRVVFRSLLLAAGVLTLLWTAIGWGGPDTQSFAGAIAGAVLALFAVVILTRFGVLALSAFSFCGVLSRVPMTVDPAAWYAGVSLFTIGSIAALAAWACHSAIRGAPSRSSLSSIAHAR
jgi:hypothetical protein